MADTRNVHPDYGNIREGAKHATEFFEESTELDEAIPDPRIDLESNELHATAGQVCVRCEQPISAGTDVRRTASGGYEHEVCPGAG